MFSKAMFSLGAPYIMTVDFMKHSEAILKSVILDLLSQGV